MLTNAFLSFCTQCVELRGSPSLHPSCRRRNNLSSKPPPSHAVCELGRGSISARQTWACSMSFEGPLSSICSNRAMLHRLLATHFTTCNRLGRELLSFRVGEASTRVGGQLTIPLTCGLKLCHEAPHTTLELALVWSACISEKAWLIFSKLYQDW